MLTCENFLINYGLCREFKFACHFVSSHFGSSAFAVILLTRTKYCLCKRNKQTETDVSTYRFSIKSAFSFSHSFFEFGKIRIGCFSFSIFSPSLNLRAERKRQKDFPVSSPSFYLSRIFLGPHILSRGA